MCNLFYIPIQVISKQAAIQVSHLLIFCSLAQQILDLRINQYQWLNPLTTILIFDLTHYFNDLA